MMRTCCWLIRLEAFFDGILAELICECKLTWTDVDVQKTVAVRYPIGHEHENKKHAYE